MAGGEGTRLRPLTCGLPKPMVPILNKPIMEYIIRLLKSNEIKDIAVTMAYLPEVIKDYFGDGSKWGVNLRYFTEDTPLGTGGSVKNAEDFLDETFIVISGDALTDIDIPKAIEFHKKKQSKATLVLKSEDIPLEYGVIVTNKDDSVLRFLEKPSWGEVFSDTINTGIYILEPEVMDYYEKGDKFDFSKDLFPKILRDKKAMYGYITEDYWCDIGDIGTYNISQFDSLEGIVKGIDLKDEYREIQKGVWIGKDVSFGLGVKLKAPVLIDKNTHIKDNVAIGPHVVIGKNCIIGEGTSVKKSIIWNYNDIGRAVQVRGSTICNDVTIGNRVNIFEKTVIGSGVRIFDNATIQPTIKIWPQKKIEENTIVNSHIIWGTKASKTLFGYRDISGKLNVDITPEIASRLGSSIATTIDNNRTMVVASDLNKGSQLIKQAIANGIIATGTKVVDLGATPIPIERYAIHYLKAQGGVYIRSGEEDVENIHIEIINEKGANIHRDLERKIENIFNRGDFERARGEKVGRIILQRDIGQSYINQGLFLLENLKQIQGMDIKIVLGSPSEGILFLAAAFLEKMGVHVFKIKVSPLEEEREKYKTYISNQIKLGKGNLGVFIYPNGEDLTLFDERGERIKEESYQILTNLIILKSGMSKKIVAPHIFPEVLEEIAKEYKGEVIRTKSSPSEVMNERVKIQEDTKNQSMPYLLYYDAIWATGKIIDFLVHEDMTLEDLAKEIPKYHYKKNHIPCNWKDKGRVLKEIISQYQEEDMELFEGVKIKNHKGWSIILPDSEKALFNIYTQGVSEEYANELSTDFSEKVKKLIDQKNNI